MDEKPNQLKDTVRGKKH